MLEKFAQKLEDGLWPTGIQAFETATWISAATCIGSSAAMLAVTATGVFAPAWLPAFCLSTLGATAVLGLARLGTAKWVWDRALERERKAYPPGTCRVLYLTTEKSKTLLRAGPDFKDAAQEHRADMKPPAADKPRAEKPAGPTRAA